MGVGRVNPPDHKAKKHIFSKNPAVLAQKLENIFLSKSVSGYYKTKTKKKKKKNLKKKWHGPLRHWCREGKTLVVRPLKEPLFFYVCLP